MRIGRRSVRRQWVLGCGGVLLVALAAGLAVSNVQRGQAVADRIVASGSPLIEGVEFTRSNPFEGSPDEIRVRMAAGTAEDQAVTFWCEVVLPAGHDPDRARVTLVSIDGGHQLAFNAVCPPSSPPS